MALLWEDGKCIAAGWSPTVRNKACAHMVQAFSVVGRDGSKPSVLACGVCVHKTVVPAGLTHLSSALCEYNLWALYQAVNESYAYCKRQLRKLLHFGEPPEEVLEKARASTVKALSMCHASNPPLHSSMSACPLSMLSRSGTGTWTTTMH